MKKGIAAETTNEASEFLVGLPRVSGMLSDPIGQEK